MHISLSIHCWTACYFLFPKIDKDILSCLLAGLKRQVGVVRQNIFPAKTGRPTVGLDSVMYVLNIFPLMVACCLKVRSYIMVHQPTVCFEGCISPSRGKGRLFSVQFNGFT